MRPVNRRERARVGDDLTVAQRESAARRHGAEVRGERAEQHGNESEPQRDRLSRPRARGQDQGGDEQHRGPEVQDDEGWRQACLHRDGAE